MTIILLFSLVTLFTMCIFMYLVLKEISAMAFACATAELRRRRVMIICNNNIAKCQRELDLWKNGKSTKTKDEIVKINMLCLIEKGYRQSIIDEGTFSNNMISHGKVKGLLRLWFTKTAIG